MPQWCLRGFLANCVPTLGLNVEVWIPVQWISPNCWGHLTWCRSWSWSLNVLCRLDLTPLCLNSWIDLRRRKVLVGCLLLAKLAPGTVLQGWLALLRCPLWLYGWRGLHRHRCVCTRPSFSDVLRHWCISVWIGMRFCILVLVMPLLFWGLLIRQGYVHSVGKLRSWTIPPCWVCLQLRSATVRGLSSTTKTARAPNAEQMWWFQTWRLFSISNIWDVILPIDFHSMIFQDGEIAPPSSIVWGESKPTFTTRPWGHHHPELRWFLPPSPRSGKLRCAWRSSPWLSAAWWRQRKTGEENGDRKWRFHGDLSNKKWWFNRNYWDLMVISWDLSNKHDDLMDVNRIWWVLMFMGFI